MSPLSIKTSKISPFLNAGFRTLSFITTVFLLILSSSVSLADNQQLPLPDEISASLLHEIPVLHTAFVQIGEELHYLGNQFKPDGESSLQSFGVESSAININSEAKIPKIYNVLKLAGKGELPLEFDPTMMDFGDNSVGKAQKQKIYIRNVREEDIYLDAIIVNSIEFQVSYFEKYKLAPQDTTSLEIVFLPREIGKRSTDIQIYSSVGMFSYKVTGNCVSNPYRISPFAGYRVPLNASVTKPIILHNPYPYTMRITEMVSSGGNGHVELPHAIDQLFAEEPPQYWDIRPYQTKRVGKLVLVGGMTENSTVFVRISSELHKYGDLKETLDDIILTVPIEVTKQRGVYATDEILDFGLLRSGERSNSLVFSVFQYQLGGRLEFETLYVEKGDHTGIYMEFASNPPIYVLPTYRNILAAGPSAPLVKVIFDASRIDFPDDSPRIKHFTGSIIAVSRGGNYNATIPFKADVFQGELKSVQNDLSLQEDLRPPHQRIIRIENHLPFDVAIWNISMSSDAVQHFTVRMVDNVVKIRAGDIAPTFILKYNKKVPNSFDNAMIYVHTNTSTFRLYLQKFSGRMSVELTSVDEQSFDFGFVERNDTRTIRFIVWNHNRAEMLLKKLQIPSRQAYRLYEVGIQKKNSLFNDVSNDERLEYVQPTDVSISPQSGKIFDLELKVPQDGIVRNGNILFETDYESKLFAVTYQVSTGSLQSLPDEINFGQTFPAKLVYRTLQVFNSFSEDMTVTRLTTLNQDPRFFFEGFDPLNPPILRSGRLTNLGRVMFSPQVPCAHEYCYLGFPLSSNDGQWFVHGLTLPTNLAEVDAYLYKKQRAKYDALVKAGKNRVNTTVILDTDKAKNIKVKTSAELIWPRLLTRNSIQFPLTALGNFTIVNLTLSNPTSMPVAVQVIPLVIYPDAEALVDLFRPHLMTPLSEHVEMNETLMFSLRDTELFTLKSDSPVPKLREELEEIIPHNVPRFTLSLLLKPHMKVRLRLGFLPSDYTLRSSLLLIRNNLTVIEPVVMYGKGARIGVKVENVEARSKQPLLFEIRHDHLTDCNNPKRLMHKLHSTLTVRRPFQVFNSGEVQFTITNMSINGVPCENRGFRILNCYPFKLQPNESYALDIAYTPDFLTTTNEADLQLYMHMNGSAWLFPLAATVPDDMMAKCHQALPRPPFENIMYYSCVTALIFCLVCVLACAYLEGDRAIACAIRTQFSAPRQLFDFNMLVNQFNNSRAADQTKPPIKPPVLPPPATVRTEPTQSTNARNVTNTPSTLRASNDAWILSRVLIKIANFIVQLVHSVWKWSLFYRKDSIEPTITTNSNKAKKKKKNPVTLVKKKEIRERGGEDSDASTTPAVNRKPTHAPQQQAVQNKKNNNLPKSPKPATNQNNNSKGRKKSTEQGKQNLAPPSQTKSRDSSNQSNKRNKKQQQQQQQLQQQKKEDVNEKLTVKEEIIRNEPPTPEEDDEEEAIPMTHTAELDAAAYQQFLASGMNPALTNPVWNTPAAQAAMQYLNLWNYSAPLSVEEMQVLIEQAGQTPMSPWAAPPIFHQGQYPMHDVNLTVPAQSPVVDETASVGSSATEDAPDWADEIVNASDAEMDFSNMAAATKDNLFTDDEANESASTLGATNSKTNNSGSRRRRSPSVASSVASSTLSKKLNSPQKMGGRRLTIGSEKKDLKNFAKTPGHNLGDQKKEEDNSFSNGWPTQLPDLATILNSSGEEQPTSSIFGTSSVWGQQEPTQQQQQQQQQSQELDPLSLSGLGMNLSGQTDFGTTSFGTMFTGREFNLWSDSGRDYNLWSQPAPAWEGLNFDNNVEEEKEKEKE